MRVRRCTHEQRQDGEGLVVEEKGPESASGGSSPTESFRSEDYDWK